MPQYVAILFADHGDGFAVTFPDLPGCVAFAQSTKDAPSVAARALAYHLEEMRASGETIPDPTSEAELMAAPDNAGGHSMPVTVP
jgi:predicted RNase H-like HicB family nuclease